MNSLVSIIVTVYNGEEYFEGCMGSILGLSYQNWECVIVNDGSTDSTKELCERYVKKDSRFKAIHTVNKGHGLARNTGIENSSGEYICFVDIDDWVEPYGIKAMVEAAEKYDADIVAGLYYRLTKDEKELVGADFSEGLVSRNKPDEIKRYNQIKTSSLFGYVWNKLYRKEFLSKHNFKSDDNKLLNLEDTLFNLKAFSKNPVYYLYTGAVYCYNVQNISYTRRAEPDILKKNIALINTYYDYLADAQLLEENLDLAVALTARAFCWALVKNAPYEGLSYRKILGNVETFLREQKIRELINKKGSIKKLFTIPSLAQRLFYSLCFVMLRLRLKRTWALTMYILYPLMKKYIDANLK